MNCKKWIEDILLKKNQLSQQRKVKDSLYNSTECSFSFHMDGSNSLLSCDMQSKNVCDNSWHVSPKLQNDKSASLQCRNENPNDTMTWNCALEISGGQFLSNFEQTPKNNAQFSHQQCTESNLMPRSLFTPHSKTMQEYHNLEEQFYLSRDCHPIQEKLNMDEKARKSPLKNASLPVQQSRHLSLQKNINMNGSLNVTNISDSNNYTIVSENMNTSISGNIKVEKVSKELLINSKSKTRLFSSKPYSKKFIYPNEITDRKLSSSRLNENKSSTSYLSTSSKLFSDAQSVNSVLKQSIGSPLQDKKNESLNKNIPSPVLKIRENIDLKESFTSDNGPIFVKDTILNRTVPPSESPDIVEAKQNLDNISTDPCPFFRSALGNKISVSAASLKSVRALWDECDVDEEDMKSMDEANILETSKPANARRLSLSPTFKPKMEDVKFKLLGKVKLLNELTEPLHQNTNTIFKGFQTASNKQIQIDTKILNNAKRMLNDNEDKYQQSNLPSEENSSNKSKSPILSSQTFQKVHDSQTNNNKLASISYCKNMATNNNIENVIPSSKHISTGINSKSMPTTETQDIINITKDFLLFSSCSSDKYMRQCDENSSPLMKKPKI